MRILFCSEQLEKYKNFLTGGKKSSLPVEYYDYQELKRILRKCNERMLIYLSLTDRNILGRAIEYLSGKENIFWAVIDSEGIYNDPSEFFHIGAVDYIDNSVNIKDGFPKRIRRIINYLKKYRNYNTLQDYSDVKSNLNLPSTGWDEIKNGEEYKFFIMYIELDGKEELEKQWGKSNLDRAIGTFKRYVEKVSKQFNGKIWIWSGFSGIVLFPFDGEKGNAGIFGFRLYLFKNIFDVEESLFPKFVSFRTAMHLGSMIYEKSNKGHIISDTINSVFHLGKRFTQPGNFCITEDAFIYLPEVLKRYFIEIGEYENRTILRLKRIKI